MTGPAAMPFPGPFAYEPRPPAMQDDGAQSRLTDTGSLDADENPDGLSPLLLRPTTSPTWWNA
jgi:hypothetical protein